MAFMVSIDAPVEQGNKSIECNILMLLNEVLDVGEEGGLHGKGMNNYSVHVLTAT